MIGYCYFYLVPTVLQCLPLCFLVFLHAPALLLVYLFVSMLWVWTHYAGSQLCSLTWYQPVICPSLLACDSSDHHLLQYIKPDYIPLCAGSLLVPWWLPLWLYLSVQLTSLNLFVAISKLIRKFEQQKSHEIWFFWSETNHIWR